MGEDVVIRQGAKTELLHMEAELQQISARLDSVAFLADSLGRVNQAAQVEEIRRRVIAQRDRVRTEMRAATSSAEAILQHDERMRRNGQAGGLGMGVDLSRVKAVV